MMLIKRPTARRTKATMHHLRQAMVDFCTEHHPLSVRNLYYHMVQNGYIPKDTKETKSKNYNFVVRESGNLRERKSVPFSWIRDDTRHVIEVYTYADLPNALDEWVQTYRRNIWLDQHVYCELWVEAKSSIPSLSPLVHAYPGLRLVPLGGSAGKSYLWECAQHLVTIDKPIHIVYAGDWDPSGCGIERDAIQRLLRYTGGLDFTLKRVAITPEQIEDMGLLTRVPNRNDPRIALFDGDSVAELEAIPPKQLRTLCEDAICSLLDTDALAMTRQMEAEDIKQLTKLAARVR
jgi:hypothetical protein